MSQRNTAMAQFYHVVGQTDQNQTIQALTLEELRQYYPNLTCVESSTGLQYVINQDESGPQFQSQVLLTADQQIVLNSTGDTPQQIIVDQSQIAYPQNQQYSVQETELVADYQSNEIAATQPVYYTTEVKPNQLLQTQQAVVQQPIITSPRVITQHVNQTAVRQISPQVISQVNDSHLVRRMSVNQSQTQAIQNVQQTVQNVQQTVQNVQQTVVTNTGRQIQTNEREVRIQYTQQVPDSPRQTQQVEARDKKKSQVSESKMKRLERFRKECINWSMHENQNFRNNAKDGNILVKRSDDNDNDNIKKFEQIQQELKLKTVQKNENFYRTVLAQDDNQIVKLNDGRTMTLGQLKQELRVQQQQQPVQPTVITNQSMQDMSVKQQYKHPAPKRGYGRRQNINSTTPRGRGFQRGRGNHNSRLAHDVINNINDQQHQPQLNQLQKSFHMANKPIAQYGSAHKNMQQNQLKPTQQQQVHQPSHLQPQSPHINQQQQRMHQLHQQQTQQKIQGVQQVQQVQQGVQQVQQGVQQVQQGVQQVQQGVNMQQARQIQQPNLHQRQMPQAIAQVQQNVPQHVQQVQQQQMNNIQHPSFQSPNGRNHNVMTSPVMHNGHAMSSPSFSPANCNNSISTISNNSNNVQQYLDDSSSSLSDEYKDSAKMLVCLENGEQRLITFTLPKETCTVMDLLEQVGVPFNSDTKIDCIANSGSDIDYIVSVGAVSSAPAALEAQQVLNVDNLGNQELEECIVTQSGAVVPVSDVQPELQKNPENPPKSPEKPPEPPKEMPKFVSGCLAVCNHCGYLSEDFNRCQRCKTKLPDDVRSVNTRGQKPEEHKEELAKLAKKGSPPLLKPILKNPNNVKTPPPKNTKGGKKKSQDIEPVILTLSSDEEEDTPSKISSPISVAYRVIDSAVTQSAISKEPVIYDDSSYEIKEEDFIYQGGGKDDVRKDHVSTVVHCRTVRIGSYKFMPKEEIGFSTLGIRIDIPLMGDPTNFYKCFIPMKYIIKILVNFSKALPVIFVYVSPSIATMIRNNLKMTEDSDIYFDPLSRKEPFKRITLLPEVICEETKAKIKDIFLKKVSYRMLEELTPKEANDILVRTCPRELSPQKIVQVNTSFSETRQLLIYPPGKGGIAISPEDYLCLAQDQFLNDVIIDFYLKYLMTDVIAKEMKDKVYIFSSFFYKRLTTKPAKASKRSNPFEVDPNLTPAEKRHLRVKNWTKNVNLFEKDYIIIPINENSHWFLAIICFPGLEGCRSMYDTSKVVKIEKKSKNKLSQITIGNTTITIKSSEEKNNIDKPIKCDEDGSDRDEAEGDDSELEDSESDSNTEETVIDKKKNQREPIKQPCILIFDSLAGASRSRVVATLRDYLTCEHRTKLNSTKTFTKDNIKGACPKVPQQMNFTDCGLYVLQYVESFFKDPVTDFHIPIKLLKNWFEEIIVTRKREEISGLIKELMHVNGKDPGILPDIQFPTMHGELIGHMEHYSEGEEEGEITQMENEETEMNESQEIIKKDESLVSDMYNSDSNSESPGKQGSSQSQASTPSTIVSEMNSMKPDISEFVPKSNRDTMSYLKSKRISRHKNLENETKKAKIE